jgi:hypothetical protein
MRFMSLVTSNHPGPPTPELMEAMGKLIEREVKSGRLIDTGGLAPMAMGARVTLSKGKVRVIDGPFVEARELIGGYAVFEFKDKDEAVAATVEFMELHRQFMPGWEGMSEVRQIAGPDGC